MTDNNVIHVDFGQGKGERPPPKRILPTEPPPAEAEPTRARDPLADLYTLDEAAALFVLSPSRLRYWERSGFLTRSIQTGSKRYYSFQDLIGLRAAKALLDEGVPLQSVRKSLDALHGTLPKVARPLCSLRIQADGQTSSVRDDQGTSYEPVTGQLRLDFEVSALRDDVVRCCAIKVAQRLTLAYQSYLEGTRFDEDERTFDRAEAAYQRAIELDPALANAYTNLALEFSARSIGGSGSILLRALQIDPEQPERSTTLASCSTTAGPARVGAHFRRALRSDPAFADAHFNLAMRSPSSASARTRARTGTRTFA